jgi:outer membrane phospholipase A
LDKQRGIDTKRRSARKIRELEKMEVKYYIQISIKSRLLKHVFIKTETKLYVGYIKPSSGIE